MSSLMPELTVFVLGLALAVTLPLVVALPSDRSAADPLSPLSGSRASECAAVGTLLLALPLPLPLPLLSALEGDGEATWEKAGGRPYG